MISLAIIGLKIISHIRRQFANNVQNLIFNRARKKKNTLHHENMPI